MMSSHRRGRASGYGRTEDRMAADGWVRPARWLRRVGTAAVLVPLIGFAVPHWLWAAGIPFGTVEIDAIRAVSGSLWALGAAGAAGALLTAGLTRRWGQVVPSWFPVAGGRPVPRLVVVVPALVVAALLLLYGMLLTGCTSATLLGATGSCYTADRNYLVANWAFTATYPVFLSWGATLGATVVGYHLLTRRRGQVCRRR